MIKDKSYGSKNENQSSHSRGYRFLVSFPTTQGNPNIEAFMGNFETAYGRIASVWPDMNLASIPNAIIMRRSSADQRGLFTLIPPNVMVIGQLSSVASDYTDTSFIARPNDVSVLGEIEGFIFSMDIADAPTFVIVLNCVNPEWEGECLALSEFAAYFLHEVFHRYQEDVLKENERVDQDAYDFSPGNLHFALIENQILLEMAVTDDLSHLTELAKDFVQVRSYRTAHFPHVDLDNQQERYEGTARFIEVQTGMSTADATFDLVGTGYMQGHIKDAYAFGSFYASGTILTNEIVRLCGDAGLTEIQNGHSPFDVLQNHLDAPLSTAANIAQAIDPDSALVELAQQHSKWAAYEPSWWNED